MNQHPTSRITGTVELEFAAPHGRVADARQAARLATAPEELAGRLARYLDDANRAFNLPPLVRHEYASPRLADISVAALPSERAGVYRFSVACVAAHEKDLELGVRHALRGPTPWDGLQAELAVNPGGLSMKSATLVLAAGRRRVDVHPNPAERFGGALKVTLRHAGHQVHQAGAALARRFEGGSQVRAR